MLWFQVQALGLGLFHRRPVVLPVRARAVGFRPLVPAVLAARVLSDQLPMSLLPVVAPALLAHPDRLCSTQFLFLSGIHQMPFPAIL